MKIFTNCLTAYLIATTTIGICQSSSRLEAFGLESKRVTAMAMAPAPAPQIYLYAATENAGVYRRNLSHPDSEWVNLGLKGKMLIALDVQVWGAGPAVFETPIVTQNPYYLQNDSTLIYRYENQTWVASDSGIPRRRYLPGLASFAAAGNEAPGFSFAVGGDFVYRSTTRSHAWEKIRGEGGIHSPETYALAVRQQNDVNEIWIGGHSGWQLFLPWIAKSGDFGATWQFLPFNLDLGIENACYAIAFHSANSNLVFAGMHDTVIKSTDGGATWQFTGLRGFGLQFLFSAVLIDPFDKDHIYAAGGEIANPADWKVWESIDAGATWNVLSSAWLLAPFGIPRLIADAHTPGVIYIATNGDGVWKYKSALVAVSESRSESSPIRFELAQNAPNPFARNEAPATVIRYQIPATQHIRVEIYDLLGKRIATLVDRVQASGEYAAQWNGKDLAGRIVPSGIYFYRLAAGASTIATRKMIVLQSR